MKEILKDSVIVLLGILVIFLCLTKGCKKEVKVLTKYEERIDTVWSKDTLVKFKTITRPKWDTIYKLDTIREDISSDSLFYVRKYNDSLSDSNITIYSKLKVIGILDTLDLSYKLKSKPILITKTITNTNTIVKDPRLTIYTGASIGTNKTIAPFISLNTNKTSFVYSFELVNKTHSIGIGYKFFSSKK